MSQNDMTIANQGFPATRADINSAIQALASTSSGATEPSTMFANQLWFDTAANKLKIRNEANSAWYDIVEINESTGALTIAVGAGAAVTPSLTTTGDTNTGIFFPAADTIAFTEGGAEAMRINSSGNVGIGATSISFASGSGLHVQKTGDATVRVERTGATASAGEFVSSSGIVKIGSTAGVPFGFFTDNTERMRIDSSGNLLIGGSVQVWDERELVRSDTNTVKLGIYGSSTSFTSSMIRAQVETAAGAGWYFFEGRSSGGSFQYGIRGNGTVATSDERRKKNIEPARSYIDDICKIRVVNYNWKSDEDTTPKELGWIAQEVAEVFPNMVVTHHDGPNDDQEVLLLKKEVFVPMLMKCIQEQQAMITALTARITALEVTP